MVRLQIFRPVEKDVGPDNQALAQRLESSCKEVALFLNKPTSVSGTEDLHNTHSFDKLPAVEVWIKADFPALGEPLIRITQSGKFTVGSDPTVRTGLRDLVSNLAPQHQGRHLESFCNNVATELSQELTYLESLLNLETDPHFIDLLNGFIEAEHLLSPTNSSKSSSVISLEILNASQEKLLGSISLARQQPTSGVLPELSLNQNIFSMSPIKFTETATPWQKWIINLTSSFDGLPHSLVGSLKDAIVIHKQCLVERLTPPHQHHRRS